MPDASVDRVQIQQVLLNLIRNAMEAMEGSDSPRTDAGTLRFETATVLISVADTGGGIPPEIEARLFQPFVTTKPDGMGIGLSVCRTIIEAHGGRLWVERNAPAAAACSASRCRHPDGQSSGAPSGSI